ncbi:CNT_collapsed_G0047220.mRNA.1.CDS.1 [Saccharomyces cerevisiae]|nr:CNT_collapsed_G0047220.mRNA.1.CDS.1 [Saccharomyces cerevisiae]
MNQPQIGTYNVGTQLTVGSHQVEIIKYLTSGGFAQVYSALINPPDPHSNSSVACLKRVIVPDKPSLNTLRAEVDAMRLLKNNRYVVSYIDSHAAKAMLHNGSYEVFVLMEYCERGGLIDFMNTRLQNRLHEFEILQTMSQVTQGVAAMHALQPPLIHRDIKIENVLISANNEYKLCDFGSVCGIIRPPRNSQELSYVQQDILKNTTAQYRSPEMIDTFRGLPIDEKSDMGAGYFLYKLCYYTTPFEKGGDLAILSGKFEFPLYPNYSEQLKGLIRDILVQDPRHRPNVYQLLKRISIMQNVPCPINDIQVVQAPSSHLNLTELHQLSATQNILSLNSPTTMENTMPNATFPNQHG